MTVRAEIRISERPTTAGFRFDVEGEAMGPTLTALAVLEALNAGAAFTPVERRPQGDHHAHFDSIDLGSAGGRGEDRNARNIGEAFATVLRETLEQR